MFQRQKAKSRFQSVLGPVSESVAAGASVAVSLTSSANPATDDNDHDNDDFEYDLNETWAGSQVDGECERKLSETEEDNACCERPLYSLARSELASLVWPRGQPRHLQSDESKRDTEEGKIAADLSLALVGGDAVLADVCSDLGSCKVSLV